jgi:hypothetical protein
VIEVGMRQNHIGLTGRIDAEFAKASLGRQMKS